MEHDKQLKSTIEFLKSIGIKIIEKELDENTFLPGLMLGNNTIYVDYSKLKYPGDILHEAGHIAVTVPHERVMIGTDEISEKWPTQSDEIVAILWSFAAATHLELPLDYVFHEHGYKGQSDWFIENFTANNYIGLPLLQWFGMAYSNEDSLNPIYAFPTMKHWMRQ